MAAVAVGWHFQGFEQVHARPVPFPAPARRSRPPACFSLEMSPRVRHHSGSPVGTLQVLPQRARPWLQAGELRGIPSMAGPGQRAENMDLSDFEKDQTRSEQLQNCNSNVWEDPGLLCSGPTKSSSKN